MSKDTPIKLDKNGRPIIPKVAGAAPQAGWNGGFGGSQKAPSAPTFTKRRTGKRGDK